MRWPGRVPAGRVNDEALMTIDRAHSQKVGGCEIESLDKNT
jgi:hypothetical protein